LDLDSLDEKNFGRICMYLVKTADYMADPDDLVVRIACLRACVVVLRMLRSLF
jgi:hypothetical protein